MRLPSHHQSNRDGLDVTMTPMIDVVFLLLIFFICTATFQPPEELLPSAVSEPATSGETVKPIDPKIEEEEEIIVRVFWQNGRIAWRVGEGDCHSLAQVRATLELLAASHRYLPVILDIDEPVPVGEVINVYDICRLSGFGRVQFAAKAG